MSSSAQEPDPLPPLPEPDLSRGRRLAAIVEAFLRQVRAGGSLDPEPFLAASEELRPDLEPLLLGVLRLESVAEDLERWRGDQVEAPPKESE